MRLRPLTHHDRACRFQGFLEGVQPPVKLGLDPLPHRLCGPSRSRTTRALLRPAKPRRIPRFLVRVGEAVDIASKRRRLAGTPTLGRCGTPSLVARPVSAVAIGHAPRLPRSTADAPAGMYRSAI